MAFKHLSELKNSKEIPVDQAAQEWTGSMETYELSQNGDATSLKVKIDVVEKFKDYFTDTFPKALQKVKQLAEK
jgi:hypothetical protein